MRIDPFVFDFEGAERAWTAIERARDRRVPVRLWRRAALCGIANLAHDTRAFATLGDVLDHVEARDRMFDGDEDEDVSIWAPADAVAPALTEHLPPPIDLPAPHFAQLWIGGRGQTTSLHEDAFPNYNFQVRGEKQFIVFDPADAPHLYRSKTRRGEFEVNASSPDLVAHPEFTRACPRTFTLVAGQSIFIPRGWPHQVVYTSRLAVNLSYWGMSQTLASASNDHEKEEARPDQGDRQESHSRQ